MCAGRYAHPGHSPFRHTSHAGQRPGAVFLRVLHLRHRRRAAMGGASEKPLFHGRGRQDVSRSPTTAARHNVWMQRAHYSQKFARHLVALFA